MQQAYGDHMLAFVTTNLRWLATGFLLAFASSFGQTWFISLFAGEIREAYGLSNGEWGAIYTVATLASAVLLFSRGALVDTMPLSRLALIVTLLFAGASGLMAVSNTVWLLTLAVFLLRFCGQGMFTHMAITSIGRWFHATRGRAIALAGLGHPIGEALLPLPFVLLIGWIGWRSTWGLTSVVLLFVVLPFLMLLLAQDREPTGEATARAGTGLQDRHWTRTDVVRHWLFPAMIPFLLTPGFIGTVLFFHQVHVSEVKGWTLAQMAPGYAVWATVSVVMSLAGGWASDRFGPERLLPVVLVPMGLGMFLIGPAQSPLAWIVALGVVAISQGTLQSLIGAFLPRVYGTRHLGSVRSLQTVLMVISSAIGPGITGLLIDWGIDFPAQGIGMGLWCIALSVMLLSVSIKLRRELVTADKA